MLRHCCNPLYIQLDGGWANVSDVLSVLKISEMVLAQIVANDEKRRYSFDETKTKIRANQGHSIPGVEMNFRSPSPPEFLYHGTSTRFLDTIMKDGLKPMKRQWVHISSDYETAVKVGARHGKPIVLRIDARVFVDAGNKLFQADNGVWLTKEVPPSFLEIY
jgi:putative RNA 2'-phosphotransferase